MIKFQSFYKMLTEEEQLSPWLNTLPSLLSSWRSHQQHGLLPKWEKILDKLPTVDEPEVELIDGMRIGSRDSLEVSQQKKLTNLLQVLHPWRKGPFMVHGIHIDTEWRSDWKWQRVQPHISPLKNRMVLDVGCGSGYHMWRMLGDGARRVIGVDPSSLFLCQFEVIKKLTQQDAPVDLLPLGIEQLPALSAFDTVFSMGVFYHRRAPIDHLLQLKQHLCPGGELVLETLVVEGDEHTVLVPPDRYAKMNNVWYLPSTAALKKWLEKCGFIDVKIVDVDVTSLEEQRTTEWMRNESLVDFLDPEDITRTVEDLPAPMRATFIATKPY